MVNDDIKVDFNADEFYHMTRFGLDFSQISHLLFTHSHDDHFSPTQLTYLRDPFAYHRRKDPLDIWSNPEVTQRLRDRFPDQKTQGIRLNEVRPFETYDLDGLSATPVKAIHIHTELCLNWLFGPLDNCVLYASDTGFYEAPTWEFLSGVKLDMVVSECTFGFEGDSTTHMSINSVRRMRDELDRRGSLKAGARFVITHFSHNSRLLHEELEERVKGDGFIVAYDGISLEAGA